jgi:hypothetical protein
VELIDKVFKNVKLIEGTKAIVDDETLLAYVDPIWKRAFDLLPKRLIISELPW